MRKRNLAAIIMLVGTLLGSCTHNHNDFDRYGYGQERITLGHMSVPPGDLHDLTVRSTASQSQLEVAGGQGGVTKDALSAYEYCVNIINRNLSEEKKGEAKDLDINNYVISSVKGNLTTHYVYGDAEYKNETVGMSCTITQEIIGQNAFVENVRLLDPSVSWEQRNYLPKLRAGEAERISLNGEEGPTVFIAFDYPGVYALFEYDKAYLDAHDILHENYGEEVTKDHHVTRYDYLGRGSLLDGKSYDSGRGTIGSPENQ